MERDSRYEKDPLYDDDANTIGELTKLPEQRHYDSTEQALRVLHLHFARAHAAVESYEQALREKASGDHFVSWDTLLSEAVGDADVVRSVNSLESIRVRTIGQLLETWRDRPDRLAALNGFGAAGLANVCAAVLVRALGRDG